MLARRCCPPAATAAFASSLLLARPAFAAPLNGVLDLSYQRVEQVTSVIYPNGVVRDTVLQRSQFFQSYLVNHAVKIGRQLDVSSQFQLGDYSYTDRPHALRTLAGSLRLAHPVFGFSGTYRPTMVKVAATSLGLPDQVPQIQNRTQRQQEAQFSGYLTPAALPRLDVAWSRHHRDPELDRAEQTSVQRSARMSYTLGTLDLHGGYGDVSLSPRDDARVVLDQRQVSSGMALRLAPRPALSMGMQYDFGYIQSAASRPQSVHGYVHTGTLGTALRTSPISTFNLGYNFRRSDTRNGGRAVVDDHDGSLLWNLTPARATRITAGGGVRSLRSGSSNEVQRFVTALASSEGTIRSGWTSSASGSHVTSLDPDGRAFSTEEVHFGSNYRHSRDLQVTAAFSGSLNGDVAGSAGRVSTQASYGFLASPLTHLQVAFTDLQYRSGYDLVNAVTAARTWTLDVRCRPLANLAVNTGMSRTGPRIGPDAKVTTRTASVDWRAGKALQLSGTYSRSDRLTLLSGTSQLSGSEVYGMRVTASLGRSTTLKAGTTQVDPRTARASRQWDLGLTRVFGR